MLQLVQAQVDIESHNLLAYVTMRRGVVSETGAGRN